jgi:hypothetical protein
MALEEIEQLELTGEAGSGRGLSARQAREAMYRFVARYYGERRIEPILQLLDTVAGEDAWVDWQACVEETLDGLPVPDLPPPWD